MASTNSLPAPRARPRISAVAATGSYSHCYRVTDPAASGTHGWNRGRDVTPPVQVLQALGRALLLDPAEREHLFLLAGVAAPITSTPIGDPPDNETVAIVAGLSPHPAYLLRPGSTSGPQRARPFPPQRPTGRPTESAQPSAMAAVGGRE